MPSSAELLFARITNAQDPVLTLNALINPASPTFEDEWLEFKGNPQTDSDLKKIWSEALSGFANTEGGVIIWGIDARKDPATQIDAAVGVNPIPNPGAFKSRLNELFPQATDPPVHGVVVREYIDVSLGGAGFVVCFVPESQDKPVRAEMQTNKPYYFRIGDTFRIPNRALLRSLFFPQARSRLQIEFQASTLHSRQMSFDVEIQNIGVATAQDVFVVVAIQTTAVEEYQNSTADWQAISNPQGRGFICKRPLHPGSVSRLTRIGYKAEQGLVPISFRCLMYSKDREVEVATLTFSVAEISNKSKKKG